MSGATPANKPFRCYRCDRSFTRSEHLQRHERSHTKEKPFHCPKCPKTFTRKDLLGRHDRLAHAVADNGPPGPRSQSSSLSYPSNRPGDDNTGIYTSMTPVDHFTGDSHAHSVDQHSIAAAPAELVQITPNSGSIQNLPFDFQEANFGLSSSYVVEDFTSFIDSIPLPSNPFSPVYQPLPNFNDFTFPLTPSIADTPYVETNLNQQSTLPAPVLAPTAEIDDSNSSRFGSRLPSLHRDELPLHSSAEQHSRLFVSELCRDHFVSALEGYSNVLAETFELPSRLALSRFIIGYVSNFHNHYPFVHIPTLAIEEMTLELLLSLTAIGALYCREPDSSLLLFQAAKAVALESVRRYDVAKGPNGSILNSRGSLSNFDVDSLQDSYPRIDQSPSPALLIESKFRSFNVLETAQALLLLIALSTWFRDRPPTREAMVIRGVLESLTREDSLWNDQLSSKTTWRDWAKVEGAKRTKFLIICFFNIHTIVFNIPPMMLFASISLDLPCTEREWRADERTWNELQGFRKTQTTFQDGLRSLFNKDDSGLQTLTGVSSLGGYILIHAVIQHIWMLQQSARMPHRGSYGSIPDPEIAAVEHALKRWCYSWERNKDCSMDPLNPDGPLSFNATALLQIAYIRINIDSGSVRSLDRWDPRSIAQSLSRSPPVKRSDKLTRAALHCAHALSIPIKLGINYVAQTQVVLWSNQHAISSLESALLLSKWLEAVTQNNPQPALTEEEKRLLGFVVEMVAETEYKLPKQHPPGCEKKLCTIVVRLWARLYRSDSIWEMVDLIGRSLTAYADMLESKMAVD